MMKNKNVKTEPKSALLKLYRGTNLGRATLAASGPRIAHKEHCSRKHKPNTPRNQIEKNSTQNAPIKKDEGDHVNDENDNIETLPQTTPIKQISFHEGEQNNNKESDSNQSVLNDEIIIQPKRRRSRGFGYAAPQIANDVVTDITSDFDFDEEEPEKTESIIEDASFDLEMYGRMCSMDGIIPCSRFKRQIDCTVADMSNCMLGTKDIKSICVSLSTNHTIKDLDLSGNDLSGKGSRYVAEALRENDFIEQLTLSECNMNLDGLQEIANVLLEMKPLKCLDMSKNKFNTRHAAVFAEVIKKNDYIEQLVLSGNELNESAGVLLGKALMSNVGIKKLDLSWNHLRREGATAVCMALKTNQSIEDLDLSWNGIADHGCKALGMALPHNHTLKTLDIACNRINIFHLNELLKGLAKNDTLSYLRIDQNPITTDGAILLLKCLQKSPVTNLSDLYMIDIPINEDFMDANDDLLKVRHVKVYHRDPNKKKITPIIRKRTLKDFDPAMVLFEYMKQENLRLIDLFRAFDTDSNHSVSKEELKEGFMTINMPLSDDALDNLMEKLDLNDNDEIEYDEYKVGYRKAMKKIRVGQSSESFDDQLAMTQLKSLVSKASYNKRQDAAILRGHQKRRQRQASLTATFNIADIKPFLSKLGSTDEHKKQNE